MDCLLVEYKNCALITRHALCYTIAGLEFIFPCLKKEFTWARKVSDGFTSSHATTHTTPLTSTVCRFFGCLFSRAGKPRLGVGITLQQVLGLRPSELLRLRKQHVLTPDFTGGFYVFRLGAIVGTKIKREQAANFKASEHPDLTTVLERLPECTGADDLLLPFSYHTYHEALLGLVESLRLDIKATPHGPRAGFATERVLAGEDVNAFRMAGRWASEQSFKTYIDITCAAQVSALRSLSGLKDAMQFTHLNFVRYFPTEVFLHHGGKGHDQGSVVRRVRCSAHGLPRRQGPKEAEERRHTCPSGVDNIGFGIRRQGESRTGALADSSSSQTRTKGEGKGLGKTRLRLPRGGEEFGGSSQVVQMGVSAFPASADLGGYRCPDHGVA